MTRYYGKQEGSGLIRTFVSKGNRDDWVKSDSKKRRILTNGEIQTHRHRNGRAK